MNYECVYESKMKAAVQEYHHSGDTADPIILV